MTGKKRSDEMLSVGGRYPWAKGSDVTMTDRRPEDDPSFIMHETLVYRMIADLRAENERLQQSEKLYGDALGHLQESGLGHLGESCVNDLLPRLIREHKDLTTENERLNLADKQWADHVKRLSEENERLRAALRQIQEWDCLNPPDPKLCADHPWLRRLVDDALA